MPIDPQTIQDGASISTILFTAAGGTVAGGGVVGVMAKIIWSQFERRLQDNEDETEKLGEKVDRLVETSVKKDDCRNDRSSCAAGLGRSIDEVKEIVKEIHKEIYVFRNGNGEK